MELEVTLRGGCPVLPETLHPLANRNAIVIESGRDFSVYIQRLIRTINQLLVGDCPFDCGSTRRFQELCKNRPRAGYQWTSCDGAVADMLP
jgi:hypothetical protein